MKTKLKKWHIVLISFVALMLAVFTSLFSLKADPVDDETGEILTDNWEISTVFYDSTVNNGATPLTEINWDASDGSYKEGTPRVIKIQITYKNNSAIKTYQPGELIIKIPQLSLSSVSSIINIGANDDSHTGYDWTFLSDKYSSGTYLFSNAITFEKDSNFEGSIQIEYTYTPHEERYIERYENECLHETFKEIQAELLFLSNDFENSEKVTISSEGWPNNYDYLSSLGSVYLHYSNPEVDIINVKFDEKCKLKKYDKLHVKNKDYEDLYTLDNENLANFSFNYVGNYLTFYLDERTSNEIASGFSVDIIESKEIARSNTLTFNYRRLYVHPWIERDYTIRKTASKLYSMDGFPQGDYYWVKYSFSISGNGNAEYPYASASKFKITDELPEGCIVLNSSLEELTLENKTYTYITEGTSNSIYVGYPKSIFNETNGNMLITNHVDLDAKFSYKEDFEFEDDDEITINLADFEFVYSGNLYSISKGDNQNYKKELYQNLTGQDSFDYKGTIHWGLYFSTKYSNSAYDIVVGDDLLYITDVDNTYRKLTDEEYYFSSIIFPDLYNGSSQLITETYTVQLYTRTANSSEFTLFDEFLNKKKTFSFSESDAIVEFYFVINDVLSDIKSTTIYASTTINNVQSLAESGYVYNFDFIEVYKNGILDNEPPLSSYSTNMTKLNIATYDQETYGRYRQRGVSSKEYIYYTNPTLDNRIRLTKIIKYPITQDVENEQFLGTTEIRLQKEFTSLYNTFLSNVEIKPETFLKYSGDQFDHAQGYGGSDFYDLLPLGMELTSTPEEIAASYTFNGFPSSVYDINKNKLTQEAFYAQLRENTTVEIVENWRGTGRTWIHVKIDISDNPMYYINIGTSSFQGSFQFSFYYNFKISYDSYLEYGSVYKNRVYKQDIITPTSSYYGEIIDNGQKDSLEQDINNDGNTNDIVVYSEHSATINSIVSTHQDVTTYVKTDQESYSTGTVDTSNNSEYEYKLRARTGAADVTNLILYTNIEEAQKGRTRWKGEFLGIDTSYAENKGYKVKPYYSENPEAGNLYNEDGTLNSDWKEYVEEEQPEINGNALAITFNNQSRTESISYDYVEIYYVLDGITYKLGKWGGTDLMGKTIKVPSDNFYLYWHTDTGVCSYYGFSIDSIVPIETTIPVSQTASLPISTFEEIKDNIYPDSAFGSYTHGNYGNNVDKLWHYTYTGSLYQEYKAATDKTKVKSLAFEYLDSEGNSAILPANSLTYVLIQMKSPTDENITTLARMDCRSQWVALDEFDRPVDFITGINSNVVKVALPNSVKEDSVPSISLRFTKEINGTDSEFENMKLDKASQQSFMIRLTDLAANEDGSYNQITALLKSDQKLIISQIPVGTYLLEELGDNYFDFSDFTNNNDSEIIIEGVTLEKALIGYILTVSEDLTENIEFNIKVTNEIEPNRFYEDKDNKENLFLKNKIEENE